MITDMTEGEPSRVLWKFTVPMLISVMFQQFYNVADSVVAGKFVGVNALAAVGASYAITMIFMAVATGLNIGCSVVVCYFCFCIIYVQG
ncbi:MATE family efflux transporter [Clostridium sp. C105KSO13]|uniref:MATE family efflux transporter n=1 Tax=Clostridium sp. C105KSO13 TaxID=1776045 RepID=UPI0007407E9C|nr:multidrug efflux pump VmrA [Clostridium sp. C105KSO13]